MSEQLIVKRASSTARQMFAMGTCIESFHFHRELSESGNGVTHVHEGGWKMHEHPLEQLGAREEA